MRINTPITIVEKEFRDGDRPSRTQVEEASCLDHLMKEGKAPQPGLLRRKLPRGAGLKPQLLLLACFPALLLLAIAAAVLTGVAPTTIIGGAALSVLLAFAWGAMLARSLSSRLGRVVHYLNKMAEGQLNNRIALTTDDELGQVLQALKSMQVKLGFDMDESRRAADTATVGAMKSIARKIGIIDDIAASHDAAVVSIASRIQHGRRPAAPHTGRADGWPSRRHTATRNT